MTKHYSNGSQVRVFPKNKKKKILTIVILPIFAADNLIPFSLPPFLSQANLDAGIRHQFLVMLYSTYCVMFPEED
jgi:hypothetical protein